MTPCACCGGEGVASVAGVRVPCRCRPFDLVAAPVPSTPAPVARRRRRTLLAAAMAVLAGACSAGGAGAAGGSSAPGGAGRSVTVHSTERIIPVNGDLAEVVFALGLGDRIVATDLSSTFPPEADAKPEIGYQRALQAEPILAFEPTVVLADELAGPPEVLDQLRAAGVAVVMVERDRTLAGPAAKVRTVGTALGVPARAEALASKVEAEIRAGAAAGSATSGSRPRVLALYVRGDSVQLAFGRGSGIDTLIEAAGGVDVGTELGIEESRPLTAESVLAARPEVLLVTTTGLASVGGVDGLVRIPALSRTPAALERRILAFEDQYLYGFGPRTGQLLAELTRDLHPTTP